MFFFCHIIYSVTLPHIMYFRGLLSKLACLRIWINPTTRPSLLLFMLKDIISATISPAYSKTFVLSRIFLGLVALGNPCFFTFYLSSKFDGTKTFFLLHFFFSRTFASVLVPISLLYQFVIFFTFSTPQLPAIEKQMLD